VRPLTIVLAMMLERRGRRWTHRTEARPGVPILTAQAAAERIEEALREAELRAFERQRQIDAQAARTRHYAAEQDAYWRPTWRTKELDRDPDPDR